MRRALRFIGWTLLSLAVLAALAFGVAVALGNQKLARRVDVRVVPVKAATDAAALRWGRYLYESRGCGECHGMDGAGRVMIDAPNGLFVRAPGLAPGEGSAIAAYDDGDWVRAIRHGVAPDGRALMIMPSEDYNRMSDADLAAVVGYVKTLRVPKPGPAEVRLPVFLKALYGAGAIQDAAQKIDHRLPPSPAVARAVNPEYGAYVANMCIGCHNPKLSGGRIPGGPPEWPPAANLTPGAGSGMAPYDTVEKFAAMMRTGKRPDGSAVSPAMPFPTLRNIDDTDLAAMHAFLTALPPRAFGEGR